MPISVFLMAGSHLRTGARAEYVIGRDGHLGQRLRIQLLDGMANLQARPEAFEDRSGDKAQRRPEDETDQQSHEAISKTSFAAVRVFWQKRWCST